MAVGVHNLGLGGQDLMSRIGAENPEYRGQVRLRVFKTHPSGDSFSNIPVTSYYGDRKEANQELRTTMTRLRREGYGYMVPEFASWNGRGYVVKGRGNQRADVRYS